MAGISSIDWSMYEDKLGVKIMTRIVLGEDNGRYLLRTMVLRTGFRIREIFLRSRIRILAKSLQKFEVSKFLSLFSERKIL